MSLAFLLLPQNKFIPNFTPATQMIVNKIEIVKKLPLAVKKIFGIFDNNIRLVGGAVRDLIINQELLNFSDKDYTTSDYAIGDYAIGDYDFACVFPPHQVIEILTKNNIKSIPTGLAFGTVTAIIDEYQMQITTLRIDTKNLGRKCEVSFTDDFFEDAKRRDFTVNALYLDHQGQVHDYFNGIQDLFDKKIRFIGNPENRIKEDYLRILRFFRFSCYYSNCFDAHGIKYCIENKKSLAILSKERVRNEFYKILNCPNRTNIIETLKIFNDNKITQILWQCNIDLASYQRLLNLEQTFKINNFVKIFTLFYEKDLNLKNFFQQFKCTNLEKKFFNKFQNYINDLRERNLNPKIINQLLVLENKEFVIDYCLVVFAKNYLTISQNNLENIINNIINFKIPIFKITIFDLEAISCPKNKLGLLHKALKIKWADNNFEISFDKLLEEAKRILLEKN